MHNARTMSQPAGVIASAPHVTLCWSTDMFTVHLSTGPCFYSLCIDRMRCVLASHVRPRIFPWCLHTLLLHPSSPPCPSQTASLPVDLHSAFLSPSPLTSSVLSLSLSLSLPVYSSPCRSFVAANSCCASGAAIRTAESRHACQLPCCYSIVM